MKIKHTEISFHRPHFVPYKFIIGKKHTVKAILHAENKLTFVRCPKGMVNLNLRIFGFGFDYCNQKLAKVFWPFAEKKI